MSEPIPESSQEGLKFKVQQDLDEYYRCRTMEQGAPDGDQYNQLVLSLLIELGIDISLIDFNNPDTRNLPRHIDAEILDYDEDEGKIFFDIHVWDKFSPLEGEKYDFHKRLELTVSPAVVAEFRTKKQAEDEAYAKQREIWDQKYKETTIRIREYYKNNSGIKDKKLSETEWNELGLQEIIYPFKEETYWTLEPIGEDGLRVVVWNSTTRTISDLWEFNK